MNLRANGEESKEAYHMQIDNLPQCNRSAHTSLLFFSIRLTIAIGSSGIILLPIPVLGFSATASAYIVQLVLLSAHQVIYPWSLASGKA